MKNNNSNKPLIKEKTLSPITSFMSDSDRAQYLRNASIYIVYNDDDKFNLSEIQYNDLKRTKTNIIRKDLRSFGENLNIFKHYTNVGNTRLNATFSKNNLFESVSKSTDVSLMYYLLINIENILQNSIKIEEHIDNKGDRNIKKVHELLAVLLCNTNIVLIIKTTIKEQENENNNIYSISNVETIKKRDGSPQMFDSSQALEVSHPSSIINIAQLVKIVNSPDILRYIPNELLSVNQIDIKNKALERYNIKKRIQIGKKE